MKQIAVLVFSIVCLGISSGISAQISITALPYTPVTTNFNSYNPSNSSNFSSTLPSGWSGSISGASTTPYQSTGTGTGTAGGFYAFGTSASGDYSLGALRSGAVGNVTYEVSFTNNSGTTINTITLAWDYEQWRFANSSGWDVSGTGQLTGNTTLDSKDFTGTSSGTNGTVSTTAVTAFTLTGLSIANGQSFGIQWVTTDAGSSDNGVAIDNFSISAAATVALPIELLSFYARQNSGNDQLTWATSCNSDGRRFVIERSSGSDDFTPIGTVDAITEGCNGSRLYRFDATSQSSMRSLYRLTMIDKLGKISYSPTASILNALLPDDNVSLAPIPAKDFLRIIGLNEGSLWSIKDAQGKILQSGMVPPSKQINISSLAEGLYFFQPANSQTIRFVKQ